MFYIKAVTYVILKTKNIFWHLIFWNEEQFFLHFIYLVITKFIMIFQIIWVTSMSGQAPQPGT